MFLRPHFCEFRNCEYIPLEIANLAIVKYIPLKIANFLILYNLQLITQQMSWFMSLVMNCVAYFTVYLWYLEHFAKNVIYFLHMSFCTITIIVHHYPSMSKVDVTVQCSVQVQVQCHFTIILKHFKKVVFIILTWL